MSIEPPHYRWTITDEDNELSAEGQADSLGPALLEANHLLDVYGAGHTMRLDLVQPLLHINRP
jgi:hypothetical protein